MLGNKEPAFEGVQLHAPGTIESNSEDALEHLGGKYRLEELGKLRADETSPLKPRGHRINVKGNPKRVTAPYLSANVTRISPEVLKHASSNTLALTQQP